MSWCLEGQLRQQSGRLLEEQRGIQRVHGAVWHLFHPPSPENNTNDPKWQANVDRGKRYGDALGDKTKMRALLAELGVKTFD